MTGLQAVVPGPSLNQITQALAVPRHSHIFQIRMIETTPPGPWKSASSAVPSRCWTKAWRSCD